MTAILSIGLFYLLALLEAFVIKTMWGWFLVPQFAFPAIGLAHAYGLSLLIGMVTHQAPSDLDGDERMEKVLRYSLGGSIATIAVGWITKQFL